MEIISISRIGNPLVNFNRDGSDKLGSLKSIPTNTMVYAPGNYKFADFLKIDTPLTIIIWIEASLIKPVIFLLLKIKTQ